MGNTIKKSLKDSSEEEKQDFELKITIWALKRLMRANGQMH